LVRGGGLREATARMTIADTVRECCTNYLAALPCLKQSRAARAKRELDLDGFESQELLAWKAGLIAPEGERKRQWDWFMLGLVLYTSVSVPFQLAFFAFSDPDNSVVGFAFDVLIDLLYIADVVISFRTTYYKRDGTLEFEPAKARRQYLVTWFPIDALCLLPL